MTATMTQNLPSTPPTWLVQLADLLSELCDDARRDVRYETPALDFAAHLDRGTWSLLMTGGRHGSNTVRADEPGDKRRALIHALGYAANNGISVIPSAAVAVPTCPTCNGTGRLARYGAPYSGDRTCPDCAGHGSR